MNPPRQTLETGDINDSGTSVILLRLSPISIRALTAAGKNVVGVGVFDFFVDVDGIRMQELGVRKWRKEGFRKFGREEGVFIGSLVAADLGVNLLVGKKHPVEEGAREVGDVDTAGGVDCGIMGELDAFDEVENDCILKTTIGTVSTSRKALHCAPGW